MYKAIAVKRGCGTRRENGVYLESGMGSDGFPIEHFLIDQPFRIDNDFGRNVGVIDYKGNLMSLGVKMFERDGIWHVVDVVGQESYPNTADMVEEVRRFGLSRHVSRNLDFSKLTPQSRIFLAHARAWVDNFDEYANYWVHLDPSNYEATEPQYNPCPKPLPEHNLDNHPEMCAGVFWQDIDQFVNVNDRIVERKMPSFSYIAAVKPHHVVPEYKPAIFASFPIHRIVVIEAKDGSHKKTYDKVNEQAVLPVDVEAE